MTEDEMVGWHPHFNRHEFEQTPGDSEGKPGMLQSTGSQRVGLNLVTAGPVFTEEMWRLACCALQDAFSATLKPVKVSHSEARAGRLPPSRRSHSMRTK